MSPPKNVKIDPEEQAALREWKALIVGHYKDDIARWRAWRTVSTVSTLNTT